MLLSDGMLAPRTAAAPQLVRADRFGRSPHLPLRGYVTDAYLTMSWNHLAEAAMPQCGQVRTLTLHRECEMLICRRLERRSRGQHASPVSATGS